MIWLALTWLALIALWGSSDRWHPAASVRRRFARAVRARPLRRGGDDRPFDQSRRW